MQSTTSYELVGHGDQRRHESEDAIRKGPVKSFFKNLQVLAALSVGLVAVLACVGFVYWFSKQTSSCPSWAVDCSVLSSVRAFISRYGLTQGIVSTIYGIGLATMGFAVFQTAETTLWPVLAMQSMTPAQIDNFLAQTRGSLVAAPRALWCARKPNHIAVLLLTVLLCILLSVDSAIVGWAFTAEWTPTLVHSNQTVGGGISFDFSQSFVIPTIPPQIAVAFALYTSWSQGLATEQLPQLRQYILNRNELSAIGNFSVGALEIRKNINCSGMPLFVEGYGNYSYAQSTVAVASNTGYPVIIRAAPSLLTTWVDGWTYLNDTSALTRVMFAAVNSTIEGGMTVPVPQNQLTNVDCKDCYFSVLACDVEVDMVDGVACTAECDEPSTTLSSMDTLPKDTAAGAQGIAVWVAGAITKFGANSLDAQPCFYKGVANESGAMPLPVANSDIIYSNTLPNVHWTQATLFNFIDVSGGAVAIATAANYFNGSAIVPSHLEMQRMSSKRSLVLLGPPAFILSAIVLMLMLSSRLHHQATLGEVRSGSTGHLMMNTQTRDIRDLVRRIKQRDATESALEKTKLEYGIVEHGYDGLAQPAHIRKFTSLSEQV